MKKCERYLKKLKLAMDPKSMLLNIIQNNNMNIHNGLFKYMVKMARVISAAKLFPGVVC